MHVTKDDLTRVIANAWDKAMAIVDSSAETGKPARIIHRRRSEEWVDCLAREFQGEFESSAKHRVFWKRNCCNKESFYKNEFLFDVMVGKIETVKSLQHRPKDLDYVEKCEWAIESELDISNSRQVVVDLSKLVVAAADNKLFVASRHDKHEKFLKLCKVIASKCSGKFYLCLIPHPKDWKIPESPCLLELQRGNGWTQL